MAAGPLLQPFVNFWNVVSNPWYWLIAIVLTLAAIVFIIWLRTRQ